MIKLLNNVFAVEIDQILKEFCGEKLSKKDNV